MGDLGHELRSASTTRQDVTTTLSPLTDEVDLCIARIKNLLKGVCLNLSSVVVPTE